jgi:hypothetical protein
MRSSSRVTLIHSEIAEIAAALHARVTQARIRAA